MTTEELKHEIVRKIGHTDDLVLLYTINQMLNRYSTHGSIYEVSESAIQYGLDIENEIISCN